MPKLSISLLIAVFSKSLDFLSFSFLISHPFLQTNILKLGYNQLKLTFDTEFIDMNFESEKNLQLVSHQLSLNC